MISYYRTIFFFIILLDIIFFLILISNFLYFRLNFLIRILYILIIKHWLYNFIILLLLFFLLFFFLLLFLLSLFIFIFSILLTMLLTPSFCCLQCCFSLFHISDIIFFTSFTLISQLLLPLIVVKHWIIIKWTNFLKTWDKLLKIQVFWVYRHFLEEKNNIIFVDDLFTHSVDISDS